MTLDPRGVLAPCSSCGKVNRVSFRQGREVARVAGARPAEAIQSFVAGHLASA